MNTTNKLVMRPVAQLIPYVRNARQHGHEQILQLRASFREFGFVAPLLIDGENNLIAGHGRLMAAKAEGLAEVPCVLVEHLTDTQRRAYILADNRLAEHATWDEELVSLELKELQIAGFDFNLTGFDENDMILSDSEDTVEDDFLIELPVSSKSKYGDVYQLGDHRLMCGDSTNKLDVATLMDGKFADQLLTDPPYNVNITGGTSEHLKIRNDSMTDEDFYNFLCAAFSCATSILAPGASFYIWHSDGATGLSFRRACAEVGLQVRQCLVWVKQCATIGRQDYQWQHEPCLHGQTEIDDAELPCGIWDSHESCLYGWKDGEAHLWCSDRKQTTVLEYDKPSRSEQHPTMKPVRLFSYEISNSTLPGAIVVDLFAGSGTTLIACEQLRRIAYLMEKDPRYVDVIINRWEEFTGQKAVKVGESKESACCNSSF